MKKGSGRRRVLAASHSLPVLLGQSSSPQFHSCIFMTHGHTHTQAVHSSAERADVGLRVGVSRQTNATQVFIPATCGINVYEWREPWALISAVMRG